MRTLNVFTSNKGLSDSWKYPDQYETPKVRWNFSKPAKQCKPIETLTLQMMLSSSTEKLHKFHLEGDDNLKMREPVFSALRGQLVLEFKPDNREHSYKLFYDKQPLYQIFITVDRAIAEMSTES